MNYKKIFYTAIKNNLDIMKYSGRFMYGEYCLAFSSRNIFSNIGEIIIDIVSEYKDNQEFDVINILDFLRETKTDNLGLDMVVYFPRIKWDDEYMQENEYQDEDEDEY